MRHTVTRLTPQAFALPGATAPIRPRELVAGVVFSGVGLGMAVTVH